MLKRNKAQRLKQQATDLALASVYKGIPSQDGALKIFNNKLIAMPDKKLTFHSKDYMNKHKHYGTFSNA